MVEREFDPEADVEYRKVFMIQDEEKPIRRVRTPTPSNSSESSDYD